MDYVKQILDLLTANQGGLLLALVCIWYLVRKLHSAEDKIKEVYDLRNDMRKKYIHLQLKYVALRSAVLAHPAIPNSKEFLSIADEVGEQNNA